MRFSDRRQLAGDPLRRQLKLTEDYCERNGWSPGLVAAPAPRASGACETHGAWELDGDRPAVILRGKRWVEDGKPVEGRKEQTESLAVTRKDGKWLLTHPMHGKYFRHEAAKETDRPARRGPDDK